MTYTAQRLLALSLLTLGAAFAQGRVALTLMQTESGYDRAGQLKIRMKRVIGVRGDGSTADARIVSMPANQGGAEVRHITDLATRQRISVDGRTKSITKIPMPRHPGEPHQQIPRCVTNDPGRRGSVLGYDVVHVVEERVRTSSTIRVEKWLAPALNCLPLREIFYTGSTPADLHPANFKVVTHVALGEPAPALFETPLGYTERAP